MSAPPSANAILKVFQPGLYTLVVDGGRPARRALGVSVGGAADRAALALGNALVGNDADAAALEVALAGPTLVADAELACVLFGAPFDLRTDRRPLAAGKTFTLGPGEILQVGGTAVGARAYLCVRGGLRTPPILGSRSSLEPLKAGAELPCLAGAVPTRFVALNGPPNPTGKLRVLDGPQASWFNAGEFYAAAFVVAPASNRMGIRLKGPPLAVPPRELASEPVCPGAVQVTRDGGCIVLGVDGQTIGGYPKIVHVIAADLDALGQFRPGDRVSFQRVALAEAEALYRGRREWLSGWLKRIRAAGHVSV